MKKTILKRVIPILLIAVIILSSPLLQLKPVYADVFAYGIQLAAFKTEDEALAFATAREKNLGGAYLYSGDWKKVYYGLYPSKEKAQMALSSARKVSKDAFIDPINESMRQSLRPIFSLTQGSLEGSTAVATPSNKQTQTAPAKAISQENRVYNQTLDNDLITNGVFGVSVIAFNLSDDWLVKEGSYINLDISHALPKLDLDSSLTLLINNRPIHSEFLTEAGVKGKTIKVPISGEWLNTGYNEIKVKTYLRLTDSLCETDNNPASWFLISKKSFLHIAYKEQLDTNQLMEYPFPYVKAGEDQAIDFSFLYEGTEVSSKVIEAMYVLASDLGRNLRGKSLVFSFTPISEMKPEQSYIYIDTKIPDALKSYWPKEQKIKPEDLAMAEVPNGKGKILFIIAGKAEQLPALTRNLNEHAVVEQLTDHYIQFDQKDLREADLKNIDHEISFEDVGYGPMTIEGTKVGTANYFLNIPNNWDLKSGTELTLQLRFSSLIDAGKSSVALSINGIPVGSKSLNPELKDNQILTFALPQEVLDQHRLSMSLTFYLSGDFDCSSISANKGIWAYVSNQSYLNAIYDQKQDFVLTDLPSPFVMDEHFNHLEIVLPKVPTVESLALGAELMGKMGQETKSSSEFTVSFGTSAADKNQIFIGSAKDEHIKALNDRLPIAYESDFQSYKTNTSLYILSSHQQEYSSVQFMKDSDGTTDLAVTSFVPEGLEWVGKYLYDAGLFASLQGKAAVVSRSGQVQTVQADEKDQSSNMLSTVVKNNETPKATFENIRNFLVFIVVMILIITVLVVLLSRRKFKS